MSQTIYWHDYETFGVDPSTDRPSQFAGIRTDLDLNIISESLMIYAQPIPDLLPSIEACLITGITPQFCREKGIKEPEFIARIHQEFIQEQTCVAGYNSLRFDDEVTRYSFYRNFYPPYDREWKNNNSRWDIIDMVRLVFALRPQSLNWPLNEEGAPSFQLERLSVENGLQHDSAHDALSDVMATILLAKKIKTVEPKLYDYCWKLRDKRFISRMIDLEQAKPMLHVSSKISATQGCTTIVMPLCWHPKNSNALICIDLNLSVEPLFELGQDEMKERLYTSLDKLPEGSSRIPLKAIHLNRCPILLPLSMLSLENAQRLGIDMEAAQIRWRQLIADRAVYMDKVCFAFDSEFEKNQDVDSALYQGFISRADQSVAEKVRSADAQALAEQNFLFEDERLKELLFRYKARHFPKTLSEVEQALWKEQVYERFFSFEDGMDESNTRYAQYQYEIASRLKDNDGSHVHILKQLEQWAEQVKTTFAL